MKLRRYIQGSRKGKDAHQLEREAMKDPFLADALEGYDRVKGNHTEHLGQMRKRISSSGRKRSQLISTWSIAASLLICIGFSAYFLSLKNKQHSIAQYIANMEEDSSSTADLVFEEEVISIQNETPPPPAPVTPPEVKGQSKPVKEKKVAPKQVQADVLIITEDKDIKNILPEPIIGEKAYREYLKKNLQHPTDSLCAGSKGKVIITFYVNEEGKPYNFNIKKSLCKSADEEAIRLVKEGPDWLFGDKEVTLTIKY